jgi:ABA4-like protein
MTPEMLFLICNYFVLPGWALLLFAPRWRWTARAITSVIIPAMLGFVYLLLIVFHFGSSQGGFGSLAGVHQLFQNPNVLLAGWIHYLAFDLFVGSYEVRDAQLVGIPHLLVIPCLLFTFMLGPIGLLAYFVIRWTMRHEFMIGGQAVNP